MKLPADLLRRPAARGARLVCLHQLDMAVHNAPRLRNPEDAESLHDFRVSLRRLRSLLKCFRRTLRPPFPRKHLRRIKKIAAATGQGRDAEVQAAYLRSWEKSFSPAHRKGVAWLRARLERLAAENCAAAVEAARLAFLESAPVLREALPLPARVRRPPGAPPEPCFGGEAGKAALKTAALLNRRLTVIGSERDVERAHEARIQGKRLRYLLEPLRDYSPAWKRLLTRLKSLQDILGELHDMHVLEDESVRIVEELALGGVRRRLRRALGETPPRAAGGERPFDPTTGLLRLARRVREREKLLFRRLKRSWNDARRARFFGELSALAEGLRLMEPLPLPAAPPRAQR
ncbi:MAG: CHAD domain-containing protein [Elusimicrobiota bacterium]